MHGYVEISAFSIDRLSLSTLVHKSGRADHFASSAKVPCLTQPCHLWSFAVKSACLPTCLPHKQGSPTIIKVPSKGLATEDHDPPKELG